ncbi:hypothetical protein AVEN_187471-1 [Araneus ventricosus]|uniref:Uncharacterized protein n=1 Tax=Araneus ventricosus TaxID=182803 RepID=A0A4Y2BTM1_ARAVE|nr:hypothetical protein AVEN_187471-1 [Araneus ventricosus]
MADDLSFHMTASPCHRSLQTNRGEIESRISDPPNPEPGLYHHISSSASNKKREIEFSNIDPRIPKPSLVNMPRSLQHEKTKSNLESVISLIPKPGLVTMPSMSPDEQKTKIESRISDPWIGRTVSPCHRSLQTNRSEIESRISDPPIPEPGLYHHAIAVSR